MPLLAYLRIPCKHTGYIEAGSQWLWLCYKELREAKIIYHFLLYGTSVAMLIHLPSYIAGILLMI